MKGYAFLLLMAAVLLLLLPLPALLREAPAPAEGSSDTETAPPESTSSATTAVETTTTATNTTSSTTTAQPTQPQTAVFRILVGNDVVTLPEREFLIRILAYEMPPSYHAEALKAQVIAAYTYYSRQRQQQRAKPDPVLAGADFVAPDNTFPGNYTAAALQNRWGEQYTAHYRKLCAAVDAVSGKTVTYNGQLIDACYFAISSGVTEAAVTLWGYDAPYLQPVASPGDKLSPQYESVVTFSPEELKARLSALSTELVFGEDPAAWLGSPAVSASGTVTSLPVGGKSITGVQARQALGLRSACFTAVYSDKLFRFTVHGYGHGVGMSQYGADYLARQGYSCEEILKYYYTGVTVG